MAIAEGWHRLRATTSQYVPRLHRGWLVASAAFLAATVYLGSSQYAFGLFVEPLEAEFGWSRTQISASFSFMALGTLTSPLIGRMLDKYGSRSVMLVSITLAGVSFALRPFMTDLWHLYAISALQFMAFSGIMMLPAGRLVAIWFKKSRGRALGLTMTGNNFGGLALTPIIGAVLVVYSWQIAYYVMAGMFLAVWLYTLAFVDENVPLETDRTDESATNEKRILTPRRKPRLTGVALSDAFRMRNFYLLAVLMPIGSLAFVVLLPHLINNFTHTGVSLSVASGAVSLLAAFGMISKVAFGALGEKITNRLALMVSFSITIIGIVLMINPGSGPLVWISAAIFGLGMGSFGPLFTMLVQDNFGLRNFGAISGVLNLPSIPTLAVGPIIGGLTYDLTNTYSPVFISVAVVIAVGVLLLTLMRPPRAGR